MTATPTGLPPRTLSLDTLAGARGGRVLFEGVNLLLRPGEAAELVGPNGAGKTTLLLILAGLVSPAAGTVQIAGGDPELRAEIDIGYLGHGAAIKPRLTVRENLAFWAKVGGAAVATVEPALARVGLLPLAWLEAGRLSAGQKRRLALARLLVWARPVWLLDEPTAALDTEGQALVARLIEAHLDRGGSALVATHHPLGLDRPVQRLDLGQFVAPVAEGG